ncbi:unnamed protein product [Fraxinus pennsylvanica]|uniref:FLZ-type domain-containing protein n=1 Tax=Fraxinus pennsylvanica TaxID=56036 RepID=A0AAD1Z1G0_9LAMI|nr:unnamed protein product [Fraxinus pennsylvanica]
MRVNQELIGSSSGQVKPPVATSSATASASAISPAKVTERSVANALEPEIVRPRIMAVASPIAGQCIRHDDQQKIGVFLERCYYCGKKIAKDSEVYMYSDFCAFCSVECRGLQIEQDQLAKKDAAKHKQKEKGSNCLNVLLDQLIKEMGASQL